MADTFSVIHGFRTLICDADGPVIRDERSATDVMGDAFGRRAEVVVVPVQRLTDDFFVLRTRVAGEIAQKFTNYRLLLVVVGDIAGHLAASAPLRDFVRETNQGDHLWFLEDLGAVTERLAVRRAA
ncbi:DUF4180 domain-containing protein [Spongiactinospora sp. TRM90649]|uniref:DUF4180 domain-containing protein n=1 Tax=Spongiactinospora sp. TRM90649 TaxID=3031114 RepID=UPI0023F73404|nr:DUF4180 domain-containing protein [Spongiactinospora sp. TRM90649]MDF5752118.1 DUF4180 domain-containing protein [Spongiactinospora sp. TRM90649]